MHVERRPLHYHHRHRRGDDESGLPDYLRTVPCEDDASSLRIQQRRRPRLWSDNPTAPPIHDYDSDSEDEGFHEEDHDHDEDDDEYRDREGYQQQPSAKRRRLTPPEYLARPHAGGLSLRAALLPARARRTLVTFSSPLIAEVRTRPRTHPDDVRMLFYSRADERRFREEARRERRLKARGERDGEEDDEMEAEGEGEGASKTEMQVEDREEDEGSADENDGGLLASGGAGVLGAQAATTEGAAATPASASVSIGVGVLEDPSEVTESSSSESSSEEEEEGGESESEDEEVGERDDQVECC